MPALDASLSSTRTQKVLAFLLQFAAAISCAGVPQWASAAIESGEQTWQLLQHAGLGGGGNAASFCRQLAVRYLQQVGLARAPLLLVGDGASEWVERLLEGRKWTRAATCFLRLRIVLLTVVWLYYPSCFSG